MLRLYRTTTGPVMERDGGLFLVYENWDALISRDNLPLHLKGLRADDFEPLVEATPGSLEIRAPLSGQEVWAAGVTYIRSREARKEESASAGGGGYYERVYDADRPELFFKCMPYRVRGHRQPIRIRSDARWSVPEPELTLVISAGGRIVGFTIGNDVCSRDIEGENPLYLPQAKIYDGSCAIGPGILLTDRGLPPETKIEVMVIRDGVVAYHDSTELSRMRRSPRELVDYLYRELSFPRGCLLMTGTGIIPPSDFSLRQGDEVRITIEPIGTLINSVGA